MHPAVLKTKGRILHGHPKDTRPVIHGSRGPEDQKKKTGRPENMRPVIHGSRGPEDQRKKTVVVLKLRDR